MRTDTKRAKRSTIAEDTLDKSSATRMCMLIAYAISGLICVVDVFFQRGISTNAITVCGLMLGSGVLHYGANTFKNVKRKEQPQ